MKKLIFGGLGVAVVVGGVVWLGLFPVAGIAGSFIWYKDISVFENSSQHFQDVAKQKDPAFGDVTGDTSARRKAYLNELIIRNIVRRGLAELDTASFQGEVDDAVAKAKEGKDMVKLAEATSQLYGMSFASFQEVILVPQAQEITLRKHIESSGKVYGDWLTERAKNTTVTIYFLPYKWQDGMLVDK
ncbi:MAG: hypothetical protein AAB482_03740 [Patescibacteria group bacterium]